MRKIVISDNYGGFHLSESDVQELRDMGGDLPKYPNEIARDDERLVRLVENHKDEHGNYEDLKVVEIPEDVQWEIYEYDGCEWVAERHRRWS